MASQRAQVLSVVVRSKSFSRNCSALKTIHDGLLGWAVANDAEFAPAKYGLLHFEARAEGRCQELPDIKGLTQKLLDAPEGYDVPHLRILGVMVDSQLSWKPHVEEVRLFPCPLA